MTVLGHALLLDDETTTRSGCEGEIRFCGMIGWSLCENCIKAWRARAEAHATNFENCIKAWRARAEAHATNTVG